MLYLLTLIGCVAKSDHFGVIFTNDYVDIYRILDNRQSDVEQLIFTPSIEEYPLWVSKDGDKIVFEAGLEGLEIELNEKQQHVYILDTNSKEFVDITSVLVNYEKVWPGFSLDWDLEQEKFMVVKHTGQNFEIESYLEFIDLNGENKEQVPIETIGEIPSLIESATLSPDGKKVVLTQVVIGHENQKKYPGAAILVYDFESKKTTQLTNYDDNCLPREWSPSSQHIAVSCYFLSQPYVVGTSIIKIFDVENPAQTNSLYGFNSCDAPSWSPNGKQIAFLCNKEFDRDGLFILNMENYELREVMLDNPVILKSPTWSPDGKSIIYAAGPDREHLKIYSIQSDGLNKHSLTSEEGPYSIVSVYPIP